MEHVIEFGGPPQDLTVTLTGHADPAGVEVLIEDLLGDPRFRAESVMLVDLSALDVSTLSPEGIWEASSLAAARDFTHPVRAVAIVAPVDGTFRAATLFRAHLGGSNSRREVFRSREEAVRWLQEQRG